jgi:ComF family protein
MVATQGAVRAEEWAQLTFLQAPWCAACGFPFELEVDEDALCGACLGDRPAFDSARAPLAYDEASRKLALDLKRAGRRDGLETFAGWMVGALGAQAQSIDSLTPTPLHWLRLAQRRYNQAAWLAHALGRRLGKPVIVDALKRVKNTPTQGHLSPGQRRRNVAGAFKPVRPERWAGHSILLVDDVFTTGATVEACARVLKRAGAREVHVVTLARVVRPADISI